MGSIDITIKTNDVEDGINSVLNMLESGASELVTNILNMWMTLSQSIAPKATGTLAESHIYELTSPLEGFMEPTAPYAEYVIYPTSPHSIGSPVFIEKGLGEWRYIGLSPNGKGKMHPGTPGQDYLEEVMTGSESGIDSYCDEYLDKIERTWGG